MSKKARKTKREMCERNKKKQLHEQTAMSIIYACVLSGAWEKTYFY
jgi:hypothetical protein